MLISRNSANGVKVSDLFLTVLILQCAQCFKHDRVEHPSLPCEKTAAPVSLLAPKRPFQNSASHFAHHIVFADASGSVNSTD